MSLPRTAAGDPVEQYGLDVLHAAAEIVEAVHDMSPDATLHRIHAAHRLPAPDGRDPLVAVITALAAGCRLDEFFLDVRWVTGDQPVVSGEVRGTAQRPIADQLRAEVRRLEAANAALVGENQRLRVTVAVAATAHPTSPLSDGDPAEEPAPSPAVKPAPVLRGAIRSNLTPRDIRDIRRRAADGEPCPALAKEYGLSRNGLGKIVRRASWAHIPDEAPERVSA
jgi:hypothetical protein